MASSFNHAQDVKKIPCNLCKVSDDALWFCKQCIKNLCDNCKEVHSNIPQCDSHTVVSVIEGLKIDTNVNITCTTHKNPLDFFCRTCDLKICAGCLTETHRQHDFCLLTDHVKHLEGILEERHNKKERDLQMVQQKIQSLEDHITRYKEEMKACGRELQNSAAQKRNQIDRMERKIQEILDSREKEDVSKMESQLRYLKRVESEHEKLLQSLNEHRRSTVPSSFIDNMKDLNKMIQSLDVGITLKLPNAQSFVRDETDTLNPGILRDSKFNEICFKITSTDQSNNGAVQHVNLRDNHPGTVTRLPLLRKNLNIIGTCADKSFESGIVSINVIDKDKVWIGVVIGNKVFLMNKMKVQRRVHLPNSPSYTAMFTSGVLLVSCGAKIKQVSLQGELETFTDLSPVCKEVLSMANTNKDEIFACLCVDDKNYKVVKLSSDGTKLLELEHPMLTSTKLSKIHDGLDGRFFIRNGNKIVIIDQMGNFLQDITCTKKLLEVEDIALDKYGRMIGVKANELLVFSPGGEHIHTYDISGIKERFYLYSLVVDNNDNLWLGLYKKVSILKYLQ